MKQDEYLDCDDSARPENIRRILDYLHRVSTVPLIAIDALENLYKLAYEGKETITFTCRYCGQSFQVPHISGKVPSVCQQIECQKQANRERVARHRQKKPTRI